MTKLFGNDRRRSIVPEEHHVKTVQPRQMPE